MRLFVGPRAAGIDVIEIRDRAAFDALRADWDVLASRCQDRAAPFLRHGFVRAWLDAFWSGQPWAALVAQDGRGLAAGLVVTEARARVGGLPARVVAAASNEHSCRLDVPRRPGEPAALGALWEHLRDQMWWDVLLLRDLVAGGAAESALSRLAEADDMPVGRWPSNRSPWIDLSQGWDGVLSRLDGAFRRDLARRRRRLAQHGEVRLLRVTGGPELGRRLDEGFALEAMAWKAANGTAIVSAPATERFYRLLAEEAAARGALALLFLCAGERPVAFMYCLEEDGWLGVLKPGYDPAFKSCAPGRLLLAEAMQEFIARGGRELDFLGPDMEWKRDWAPRYRQHVWWYAFRPTLAGRLRHALKFRAGPWGRAALAVARKLRPGRPKAGEEAEARERPDGAEGGSR